MKFGYTHGMADDVCLGGTWLLLLEGEDTVSTKTVVYHPHPDESLRTLLLN